MSIRVENLSVKIGRSRILDEVSFEAKPRETLAVLGANGAGKSTLLRVLSGESIPFAGEVFYGEKNLRDWKAEEISKIRSILPQSQGLNFPFKSHEVALLGRTPHINFKETKYDYEIVSRALAKVEAAEFANRFYPTLSGGERQRVQLARVLAQIWERQDGHIRYLLLDEPTASLDLAHQHLTLQTARNFANDDTVVVTVLHDLNLAAQYADKILLLKKGKVAAFDKPKNVLHPEKIKEVFGIDVYIAKHEDDEDIPLIVPLTKRVKTNKAAGANA